MCVCIYIYIYMDVSVAGGIISCIYEAVPECLEDLLLSILVQSTHKELCSCEPARSEERVKAVNQLGVRLQSRESDDSGPGYRAGLSALRRGSRAVRRQYGVKNKDTEQ